MAESNTTDGGRIIKMEVDYSSTCDEKIPICKALAAEGKINEGLEILYALEKQTRTVSLPFFFECFFHRVVSLFISFPAGCRCHLHWPYLGSYCAALLRHPEVGSAQRKYH